MVTEDAIIAALDRLDTATGRIDENVDRIDDKVRRLNIWVATAIAAVLISLAAVGGVGYLAHRDTVNRKHDQCTQARNRITVVNDAIDDVLDALYVEVRAEPAAVAAVHRVRVKTDAHLAAELAETSGC